MDRGAGQTTVHGAAKSWTQLCNFHFHFLKSKVKLTMRNFTDMQKCKTFLNFNLINESTLKLFISKDKIIQLAFLYVCVLCVCRSASN